MGREKAKELMIGDEVYFVKGLRSIERKNTRIIGETKTQWVLDRSSYNHVSKSTLYVIGGYDYMRIEPMS